MLEWGSQFLTPGLVGSVLLGLLALLAVVAVIALLLFLRFRRHRGLRRTVLRLRADYAESGPRAEVIDLRLHLQEELGDTRRSVRELGGAGALAGDLPDLFERLERSAERLDRYLQVLERTIEAGGGYGSLVAARERVTDVIDALRDLQRAALAALDVTTTSELQGLMQDVEREVDWVQSGVEALHELDGRAPTTRMGAPPAVGRTRGGPSRRP